MCCAKTLRVPRCQRIAKLHDRSAARCVECLHARPRHWGVHTQTNRFGEGFFCGKPGCQKTNTPSGVACEAPMKNSDLLSTQYATKEFFAMTVKGTLNT